MTGCGVPRTLIRAGRKGWLAAFRDAALFKVADGYGPDGTLAGLFFAADVPS